MTTPIDEANAILAAFLPGAFIEAKLFRNRTTYYLRPSTSITCPSIPLMLGGDGSRISTRPTDLAYTHDERDAIGQLLRHILRCPVRPVAWWSLRFASRDLQSASIGEIIHATSYGVGRASACVLCGDPNPLDWWSDARIDGPCCSRAACRTSSVADFDDI